MKIPPCLFWMGCPTISSWVNRPFRRPGTSVAPFACNMKAMLSWWGGKEIPKGFHSGASDTLRGLIMKCAKWDTDIQHPPHKYLPLSGSCTISCRLPFSLSYQPLLTVERAMALLYSHQKSSTAHQEQICCPTITMWYKLINTLSNIKLLLWAQSLLGSYSLVITTFSNCVCLTSWKCVSRCSSSTSSIVSLISALDLDFGQSVLGAYTLLQEHNCNVQKNTSPCLCCSIALKCIMRDRKKLPALPVECQTPSCYNVKLPTMPNKRGSISTRKALKFQCENSTGVSACC